MDKKIQARFNELHSDIKIVIDSVYVSDGVYSGGNKYVDNELYVEWLFKVQNLFVLCMGEDSMYYKRFVEQVHSKGMNTNFTKFEVLTSIFKAAKNDYENGYLTSMRALITAEVFDNELEQAKELLATKYHVAAAVIAGTVLETGLRELCDAQNPQIAHGKLDKMNADLKKSGVYNQLLSKRITALADIRNSAAHGKISEFTHDDVQVMIRDIESFLATHISD